MSSSPLVSIIVPVYNGEAFLTATLEAILKTDYSSYEVVLVDDGSTDASKKICDDFSRKYDFIHSFSWGTNKGLAETLNFAIAQAKGDYIARINQDDLIAPGRLSKQVLFLESHPDHSAVGSAIRLFDNENLTVGTVRFPETDEKIKKNWLMFSPFSDPAVMYRKTTFLKTSRYQKQFWPVDDVHMWYELGAQGKLANLSQILTYVRWHDEAGSIKNHRIQVKKLFELHLWANRHIRKANIIEWIFWISQLAAGYLFPPRLNWWAFRLLRKFFF